MLDRMKETIREHEETIDLNEPRDFTDKALIEIKKDNRSILKLFWGKRS